MLVLLSNSITFEDTKLCIIQFQIQEMPIRGPTPYYMNDSSHSSNPPNKCHTKQYSTLPNVSFSTPHYYSTSNSTATIQTPKQGVLRYTIPPFFVFRALCRHSHFSQFKLKLISRALAPITLQYRAYIPQYQYTKLLCPHSINPKTTVQRINTLLLTH